MIVRVSVVLRRIVCDDIDWRFDNLSESHHQSPSQEYTHPDDHKLPKCDMTPGFKPFTVWFCVPTLFDTNLYHKRDF